jgi:TP901 family phage tail tape measure protein
VSAGAVRMGRAFVEIGGDPSALFRSLAQVNRRMGQMGANLRQVGARMTAVTAAMAAPVVVAARRFAAFDDAIRLTGAVSGATGADLQSLTDRARKLGETTSFTAVQVAELMGELGRAGFRTDEINNMTAAVLNLARASGTDATLSAGIMAATLRQFSLGAGDAARAADVLTKAANATFNTVEGLGESLKYAGPVASSLGMSLEDTVAVLGVLGNVGIQGSEAGTALRRLSVIAAGSGDELQKLFGITNTDAAGNLKPLVDVLDEINTVTAGMPVAERTAKMKNAFGLLGITSATVLSQSAGGVRGLADELRNADGVAARTAREMDAGLGGSLRILLSAIEGTGLALGDALAPSLQALAKSAQDIAGGLTAFIKANGETVVAVATAVAQFGAAGIALIGLGSAIQLVSFGLGGLLQAASLVVVPLVSIVGTAASMAGAVGAVSASLVAFVPAVLSAVTAATGYVAAVGAAGAASVVAGAQMAASFGAAVAADMAALAAPLTAYVTGVAAAVSTYVTSMATAVATTVSSTATMAASWVSQAILPITTWATTTATSIMAYVTSLATAVTATVTSAATMAASWLATAMPATTAWAAAAVASLTAYIGSTVAALAASVASAAGMAVAWLAALAPIAAVAAAVAGVVAVMYSFSGVFSGALSWLSSGFDSIASSIGGGLSTAVGNATRLFGDLRDTAMTAFSGIYDAIAAGDLESAMNIAMAGLKAAWARGSEALMGSIDSWAVLFQNTMTYMWAGIKSTFGDSINWALNAFDNMVVAVQKSWNYVQSFIRRGFNLAQENQRVESAAAARRRERETVRGSEGVMAEADATAQGRLDAVASRAADRRASTQAAESYLGNTVRGASDARTFGAQFADLLKNIEAASTIEQLRDLYGEYDALSGNGRLTAAQAQTISDALDDAQMRISRDMSSMGGGASAIQAGAGAAGVGGRSTSEVVGTFSANTAGLGFGTNLQQQMADYAKRTADATERLADDGMATAAA